MSVTAEQWRDIADRLAYALEVLLDTADLNDHVDDLAIEQADSALNARIALLNDDEDDGTNRGESTTPTTRSTP